MKVIDDKQELCRTMWLQHSDELKRLCERKLNSCRDEIDDVIADAFYYLCVNVFEGKIHTNTSSWLFAVTNNLIKKKYTEMNKRKQRHICFDEANIEQYDCYSIDDDVLFEGKVSENIIDSLNIEIIDILNPAEQQLYKYVYKDKLSLREIADKMNLTYGAIKERNHRLNLKIKIMVKEHIESLG
ncbi:MAG: sigma-70 family RNA polymerase sigma factor [Clostridia bacterium]|nr:sigma-70 family RNA polymerase sigma factor [Clostridia bacterium]